MAEIMQPEWIGLCELAKRTGISAEKIKSYLHNGRIPFQMKGTRYIFNYRLVRAYLLRMDIENMNMVTKDMESKPFDRKRSKIKKVIAS